MLGTTTEEFVRRKRILFSQLPKPTHPETQQLDMIFKLLWLEIREKILRASINNFKELSLATEQLLYERSDATTQSEAPRTKEDKPYSDTRPTPSSKTRCRFFKKFSHSVNVCRT
jgi:hypothetical protein